MNEIDLNNLDLTSKEVTNILIEKFGDEHLEKAVRVMTTQLILPMDARMVTEALSIVLSIYAEKIKSGEINKDKVIH